MDFKVKERNVKFENVSRFKSNKKCKNIIRDKDNNQRKINDIFETSNPAKKIKLDVKSSSTIKITSPASADRNENLRFYRNEIPCRPNGDYLKNILANWADDFEKLEEHHGFIQWMFPLTESGMNLYAKTLTEHEINMFKKSINLQKMLIKSYGMMLKFYGFKLENPESGDVSLHKNHAERFHHLSRSHHNFLRITRIIKCLSLLGLERITYPFLEKLIHLCFNEETNTPLEVCKSSCVEFWIQAISQEKQKIKFYDLINKLEM